MDWLDRVALTTIGIRSDRHRTGEILPNRLALRSPGVSTKPEPPIPDGPDEMGDVDDPDLLELEVGAVAAGGGCVARAPDGKVVFVRHSLPGERVRARVTASTTSYLRADAVEILDRSPERVDPPCPHAGPGRCGGCDFQHVDLAAQRRLKAFRIAEQLERLAGLDRPLEVEPVPGDVAGLGWRSRVRVAVDGRGAVGFRRHRSHRLEYVRDCPVASPAVAATGALSHLWPGATELEVVTGPGSGESVVSVRPRGRSAPRLPDLGTGLVVGGKVRRPPAAVHAVVGAHTYRISPGVFWQVHTGAAATLQEAVMGFVGPCGGASVADLYAGAGLFAVPLAEAVGPSGSVLAVERDGRACADARHNGATFPNLRVLEGDVTPALVESTLLRPDIVVLDPARQGAGTGVMRALAAHIPAVRTVVYVSCDPASLGRDIRVLLDEGWRVTGLRAFDIFPMTEHVELVAGLEPPSARA
jgi:tRNA/tmRNA/rRNA uracil-C5-methylase (TrmA/RlmC/RlmD family)